MRAAAEAAVRHSDDTATDVLLDLLGGPQALDAAPETIGDDVTRVDRTEPTLDDTVPGDPRDTSTPRGLAGDLRARPRRRAGSRGPRPPVGWLTTTTTGDARVWAGVPAGWVVGEESGAAAYGTRNDTAVVRPPRRAPIVVAVLSDRDEPDAGHDDALVAEATRAVVAALS
ncbi:serine hydrolase [Geodermatophilus sp. DSM 44513]|uniref:serine hydrolase n=1 Tax=Geodermatophilus sp. DSM 44513 TaxID=1528104 RepID=UPI00126FFCF7|nr:serine hydrolase [Geodermatophilus sp. DSM 44513]WNV77697.1 serine hydrolase [Geodermatophilus sp. DSM 44513]